MSSVSAAHQNGFGATSRRDGWWVKPLLVFLGFSAFVVYTTWAAFQGDHYWSGNYLSPLYAPELWGKSPHALLGREPGWWPSWLPYSPAFLILWIPGLFRFTCYYYRGAYYKAFWADPPACAVAEPRKKYLGENSLPLILQNIHRYFFYLAFAFIFLLSWEAWKGMWFLGADGKEHFGIGVGTLVLVINVILLGGYTLGCHSFRHLVGGFLDVFSRHPVRKACWSCVTCLNKRHQLWAWLSLFWVGFTDVYVRLLAHGTWTDVRIL
jgi:hypothetical protein